MLDDLPICQRLVKEAHSILLDSVRGKNRGPGIYRKSQNWIGPPGCDIEDARFVPVSAEKLPKYISSWEKYVNSNQRDKLVQLAIIHAEFEALHPFLDGNGRLGRMLVPLFMYSTGLIQSPMFYISSYFEVNRDEYYERLLAVSRDGDWTGWCEYFLVSVIEQAKANLEKASDIQDLYNTLKVEIPELTRSQYAIRTLDWLFERPIFKSSDYIAVSVIPGQTARRILTLLKKNGIIKVFREASGSRPAVYLFPALLNIAEGKDVF